MDKKRLGIPPLLVLTGAMMLGGCGDSTGNTPSTQVESATPSVGTTQDCRLDEITGQSKNQELQALAAVQYEALDCAGDLGAQLTRLGKDPALKRAVSTANWELTTGEALDAVTLSIVDVSARTSCMITVNDSLKAKQMYCGDL